MQTVHERCAGLDVHKETVVACVRIVTGGRVQHEVATFATTTAGLLRLRDWLAVHRCTHVAMEATGIYWRPVWHVLEGQGALVLANPAHVRNVPGRKTDVNDAVWLADLLAHGLVRASFVPPRPIQELRDLTRTRKQLVRQVVQHTLRIQKTLEDAHLKITGVVADLLGVSGRAILQGLIEGETDPGRLLARTTGRLRAPACSTDCTGWSPSITASCCAFISSRSKRWSARSPRSTRASARASSPFAPRSTASSRCRGSATRCPGSWWPRSAST
jgi:hypothetical protein